jgi:hypothetical protein
MTAQGHNPRPRTAREDKPELAGLVRLVIQRHGFRRVHASCAIAPLLGAVLAVWVPLLIGAGGAQSTPRLVVGVLVAVWVVGVMLNSLVVWVLVRIQPRRTIPDDLAANHVSDDAGAGPVAGSARLVRLVALPGAVALAALQHRGRRRRVEDHNRVAGTLG